MNAAISSKRIYGLDILRTCAILFVVYGHGAFIFGPYVETKYYNLFALDGVSIFFVLSGFLIGGILLKIINGTDFNLRDLLDFWMRRWFRTLPNYFLILALLIGLTFFDPAPRMFRPPSWILWKYLFFLQNFRSRHPEFFPEAWSLCVEEYFYLITPILLFLSFKLSRIPRKKTVLFWIIAIIVAITSLRCYRAIHYNINDWLSWEYQIRKQVITRLDSLMFGFLGAYLLHYHKQAFYRFKNTSFVIGLCLLFTPQAMFVFMGNASWTMEFLNYFFLTSGSVGALALLPKLSSVRSGKGRVYKAVSFISIISYSMYLLNLSVVQFHIIPRMCRALGIIYTGDTLTSSFLYTVYWVATIGLSYILYRFYEKPMTNLRDKISLAKKSPARVVSLASAPGPIAIPRQEDALV